MCHHPTRRSDNEETWDELTSEVKRVAEHSAKTVAKAMRKIEEGRVETQASIASLNQCINTLRKSYQKRGETSRSLDGWSQTRHTRNDESGLTPQRESRPITEGHEQDGPPHHPSNGPDDRSQRLSPQNSQRDPDRRHWWMLWLGHNEKPNVGNNRRMTLQRVIEKLWIM